MYCFLGFNIFRRKRRNGKGWIIVFQTEDQRLSRVKQRMKAALKRMSGLVPNPSCRAMDNKHVAFRNHARVRHIWVDRRRNYEVHQ